MDIILVICIVLIQTVVFCLAVITSGYVIFTKQPLELHIGDDFSVRTSGGLTKLIAVWLVVYIICT